jgi:hypothetical protein
VYCPALSEPECGCNGKTYANWCERMKVAVEIKHRGPCKPGE